MAASIVSYRPPIRPPIENVVRDPFQRYPETLICKISEYLFAQEIYQQLALLNRQFYARVGSNRMQKCIAEKIGLPVSGMNIRLRRIYEIMTEHFPEVLLPSVTHPLAKLCVLYNNLAESYGEWPSHMAPCSDNPWDEKVFVWKANDGRVQSTLACKYNINLHHYYLNSSDYPNSYVYPQKILEAFVIFSMFQRNFRALSELQATEIRISSTTVHAYLCIEPVWAIYHVFPSWEQTFKIQDCIHTIMQNWIKNHRFPISECTSMFGHQFKPLFKVMTNNFFENIRFVKQHLGDHCRISPSLIDDVYLRGENRSYEFHLRHLENCLKLGAIPTFDTLEDLLSAEPARYHLINYPIREGDEENRGRYYWYKSNVSRSEEYQIAVCSLFEKYLPSKERATFFDLKLLEIITLPGFLFKVDHLRENRTKVIEWFYSKIDWNSATLERFRQGILDSPVIQRNIILACSETQKILLDKFNLELKDLWSTGSFKLLLKERYLDPDNFVSLMHSNLFRTKELFIMFYNHLHSFSVIRSTSIETINQLIDWFSHNTEPLSLKDFEEILESHLRRRNRLDLKLLEIILNQMKNSDFPPSEQSLILLFASKLHPRHPLLEEWAHTYRMRIFPEDYVEKTVALLLRIPNPSYEHYIIGGLLKRFFECLIDSQISLLKLKLPKLPGWQEHVKKHRCPLKSIEESPGIY